MTYKFYIYPLLIFIFITTNFVNAQTGIGFKAGMLRTPYVKYQYSKYSNSDINFKNTFAIAFWYKEEVSRNFTIGANLSYDFYKADYYSSWWNPNMGGGLDSMNLTFGYIGLYFYPQLEFGKNVKFFINVGPYIGFLANSHTNGVHRSRKDLNSDKIVEEIDGSAKEYVRPFTYALMSTAGIYYSVNKSWKFTIDFTARYGPSLFTEVYGQGELDLIFSTGIGYTLHKKTAPE